MRNVYDTTAGYTYTFNCPLQRAPPCFRTRVLALLDCVGGGVGDAARGGGVRGVNGGRAGLAPLPVEGGLYAVYEGILDDFWDTPTYRMTTLHWSVYTDGCRKSRVSTWN